jgi:hypothetical protein
MSPRDGQSPNTVDLPQRLSAWFAEHEERLQSRGITSDVQRSPEDGRPKTSAWMTLRNGDHEAVFIVWSSGDTELGCGDMASGSIRPEHRDLRTRQDLLDALASIQLVAGALR